MSPVYRLGFGEPFLISAEHGQGVGDLLDAILKELPDASMTLEDERGVQIAIVGRPNVGKSSLINRILGQRRLLVDNAPGTTRDAIDSVVRVNARCYTLIDTAGMRKFRQISESLEKAAVTMSLSTLSAAMWLCFSWMLWLVWERRTFILPHILNVEAKPV